MHDARHGAVGVVSDRVRGFPGRKVPLRLAGQELARDGVRGVGRVDEGRHSRGQGDGVARGDGGQRLQTIGLDEPRLRQLLGAAQGAGHGAHSTPSMREAPVASITSRSKPNAAPLAGGMCASAARKSSSMG